MEILKNSDRKRQLLLYYISTGEPEPALVAETDGRVFRMNSAYSPTNEAAVWGKQYAKSSLKRIMCLFGLGTGLFAEELLSKLSDDSTLIIVEPEKDIMDYCRHSAENGEPTEKTIWRRIERIASDRRVKLCVCSEDRSAFRENLLATLDYYLVEGMTVAKHTFYDRLYENEFLQFLHTINEIREQIYVNKNTLARFKENAAKNILTNMWIIEKMNLISQLKEILPREVPVIIVAAGPSLDKNVELLRKAKGHCLIFAVDTAIPYLLQRNIIPDLTITVEPIKPVKHYLDPRSEEIPAVFDCESNPEIVGKHRGRLFICNCRGFVKRLLEATGRTVPEDVAGGGSVATSAFALLYQLEMKHIILIGQDLAYSGEATHAGGVESKGINNNIGYEMVEDIYGGQVRTRSDWLGYLRWFERAIAVIKDMNRDITVTDATEGGAKIHGSEIMTLEEALLKYCGIKCAEAWKNDHEVLDSYNPENEFCEYKFANELSKLPPFLSESEYDFFLKEQEKAYAQLEEMKFQAINAVKKCDSLIEQYEKNNCDLKRGFSAYLRETEKELTQIRIFCEKCYMYPLINDYAVSDIAEAVSRLRLTDCDEGQTHINEIRQQRLAFDAIAGACDVFSGYLK